MTLYSEREGRTEFTTYEPMTIVHLRCVNCGYGRMRRRHRRTEKLEDILHPDGLLHCCELCGYPERVHGVYPRMLTVSETMS